MRTEPPKRDASGKFIKGGGSYWTGKKFSDEYRKKLSDAHKGKMIGRDHPLWKGESASYNSKHNWVSRHLGKPNKCEHCKTESAKKFEWANISGEYHRDLGDWVRLCTSCHHKLDNIKARSWDTRRKNAFVS